MLLEEEFQKDTPQPTFQNYEEVLTYIETHDPQWGEGIYATNERPLEFNGHVTLDGAINLARSGWEEGRNKIVKDLERANYIMNTGMRRAINLDVAGAYPIVPLAVAGDPNCMVNIGDTTDIAKPIVRIWLNLAVSGAFKGGAITNRGIAVLSHIDRLENEGRSVELTVIDTSYATDNNNKPPYTIIKIIAKRAGEPLELDKLAFILAHPASLRRIVFALYERMPKLVSIRGYYGKPLDPKESEIDPGVIYIPACNLSAREMYGTSLNTLDGALIRIGSMIDDNMNGTLKLTSNYL